MKKTRIFAILMCAVLCFTTLFGCGAKGGASGYTKNNEEFVIGVSGPLTGAAAV